MISLLESWSDSQKFAKPLLPDARYFDEKQIFVTLIEDPTRLSLPELILFSGYSLFIQEHEGAIDPAQFQEWMRIVRNLAINSYIERVYELGAVARGLREILPRATEILVHFSRLGAKDRISGFAEQQVKEETLKASLLLSHDGWRPVIDRAEGHGYFCGQIEFLCEFSGAAEQWKTTGTFEWDGPTHQHLQKRFEDYLKKAEGMFNSSGLASLGEFQWQRALLSLGDYLLPSGINRSFLLNAATESASWKRLLRGTGPNVPEKRQLLKQLWDRLTTELPFAEQLNGIIAGASKLESWIEAFVRTPQALTYCTRRSIRWVSQMNIYLLSKSQMNGSHAELYSYCLYHNVLRKLDADGSLKPLELYQYQSTIGTDEQPYIRLNFVHPDRLLWFWVEFEKGRYHISINRPALENLPEIQRQLCGIGGFSEGAHVLSKVSTPDGIENTLVELARLLANIPNENTAPD